MAISKTAQIVGLNRLEKITIGAIKDTLKRKNDRSAREIARVILFGEVGEELRALGGPEHALLNRASRRVAKLITLNGEKHGIYCSSLSAGTNLYSYYPLREGGK